MTERLVQMQELIGFYFLTMGWGLLSTWLDGCRWISVVSEGEMDPSLGAGRIH